MFHWIRLIPFFLAFVSLLLFIVDLGFDQSRGWQHFLRCTYVLAIAVGIISTVLRWFIKRVRPQLKALAVDAFILIYLLILFVALCDDWNLVIVEKRVWFNLGIFLVFVREFSALKINFRKNVLNPAQLFILSFLLIIFVGSGLLMLPNATYEGISFVDALFTSTSAVCVTGLAVVDTGTFFTPLGQTFIVILIQVGGIGIMTFTSYFSYFFRGGSTYENQLLLKDMANADKIAEVFSTLKKIILLTFLIELIGAISIYITLDSMLMPSILDRAWWSLFHSVSAFCNAGFSTLTMGLYDPGFRFNYSLHLIIAGLIILGGIGFPLMFNLLKYLKYLVFNRILPFSRNKQIVHVPWVININSRIVFLTTGILLVLGTVLFFIFDYNNTLAEHGLYGKVVTSFFGAVSPRTAGFNTIDMTAMSFSTVLLVILLMWIGASPGGTGGGIKTTTFAIATMNFLSLARGKDRLEIFRREVSDMSVRRAFAAISLSLVVIGMAVFFVASFDGEKDLLDIAFECFSAYSTVGLSLGITTDLTDMSKITLSVVMFIGRVSMLTILVAVLRKIPHLKYRYPSEEIMIN